MRRSTAMLLVLVLVLPSMTVLAETALASPDWPQARQNAARTGVAAGAGSIIAPTVLQQLALGSAIVSSPLIADLDGDGLNDVVAVSDFSAPTTLITVHAYLQGSSGLVSAWSYAVPIDPLNIGTSEPYQPFSGQGHVAVGDLNGDGKAEVAVYTNYVIQVGQCTTASCPSSGLNDGRLTVLDGKTGAVDGILTNADITIGLNAAPAIGDVTGDGVKDIVLIHQVGGTSSGYYLMGVDYTGSLTTVFNTLIGATSMVAAPALAELRSAHAGLEVIVAEDGFTTGKVYLCKPGSGLANCNESIVTTSVAVRGIAVGDMNGDGVAEIAVNGRGTHTQAFTGNSFGIVTTGNPMTFRSRDDGFLWNTPSLGDVDGDGKLEAVNVQFSDYVDDARSGDILVRGFNGVGITTEGTLARSAPGSNLQSRGGGSLVDLDGDGRAELVFGSADGNLVAVKFSASSAPSAFWSKPLSGAPFSPVAAGDVNGDGKSDLVVGASDGTLSVIGAAASPPGAPTGLAASAASQQVTLTWGAPASDGGSPITGYKVFRGTASGGEALLTTAGLALTFTDTTVSNGVTYFYQVSATNANGESARSNEASATPSGAATAPTAPQGLTARAGDQRATLVWSSPASDGGSPVASFRVYRGTASGSETLIGTGPCSVLGNVLTCTDLGLTNNATYFYQVSAVNAIGEGPRSGEASVKPTATSPLLFQQYNAPLNLGDGAGEPGIGVNWNTGNVFINSFPSLNLNPTSKNVKVLKAQFDDSRTPPEITWTDVTGTVPPATYANVDPVLFQDSITGRIWAGGDDGCNALAYSDNDGQSWSATANPCAEPGEDHPTVGSGPYAGTPPPAASWPNASQPRAVYTCGQTGNVPPVGPGWCARSDDGGITFANVAPPWLPVNQCIGLHGHIRVANDGTAFLPDRDCFGKASISVTEDNGQSWIVHGLPGTKGDSRFDPSVAPTEHNWAYLGAAESDGAYIGLTKDKGATWQDVGQGNGAPAGTKAFNVGRLVNPPVIRAEFAEVIAGDDERAAFAFLGSSSISPNAVPDCDTYTDHVWHMYVALTYDSGKTWQVQRVTDDPVQLGPIGNSGDVCRDMLDFNDITVDAQGRVLIGYSDGCIQAVNGCRVGAAYTTSQRGEGNAVATIARQYSGRGLFARFDQDGGGSAPLSSLPGGPYEGNAGSNVALAGSANGGIAPYTFTWSVAAKPSGSVSASFSNPNAQSPTFLPDVAGTYTLRLDVHDSALAAATATTTLNVLPAGVGCQPGGVIVAKDSAFDGGEAGTASEGLCLRASDEASTLNVYL
ncbi:MAG: FG-GAP-like repeat-containing protein, partial [Halobacteriales archaeon]|nr:FG-GAP-like repeat-containing protein [Halobacteriales archaeon]